MMISHHQSGVVVLVVVLVIVVVFSDVSSSFPADYWKKDVEETEETEEAYICSCVLPIHYWNSYPTM